MLKKNLPLPSFLTNILNDDVRVSFLILSSKFNEQNLDEKN